MTKNLTIKSFAKKDLEELSRVKTGDTVLSFYLGIRPEVNFKSEANSLAAGKIKEVKGNKAYSKAAKKKMIGMIGEIKEEIDLLRSPDEARTIIVFAGIEPGKRLYRFPAYISSRFVIERDPYIHPALVAMENFPRYLAVIVERDKAVFMNIFSGEIEG